VSVLAGDGPARWEELPPEALAGIGYYRQENCSSCHTLGESEPGIGPDLSRLAGGRTAAWMIEHFKRPSAMVPGTAMPSIQLTNQQMNALAQFLLNLTPENAQALQRAPREMIEGAKLYQENQCGFCHPVNGVGRKIGPSLNGLSNRRTREWVVGHFLAPQTYSPETTMPPYQFSPKEMDLITNYLFALP
jgi:ubiquinol-cytochrome c reductase cytochrome b subunit